MSKSNIQEVFGKFVVELEDGAKLFDTHADALEAETDYLKGAEFREEAKGFNTFAGNEGKNAKGKSNVIVAYLSWVEAGKPEAPTKEVIAKEENDEADAISANVVTEDKIEVLDADGNTVKADF